jgi:hypothetical protein
MPDGHNPDIGQGVCDDGTNARCEHHPLRELQGVKVIPWRAYDRRNAEANGQAVPTEPAGHPPRDEVDWGNRDRQPEIEQRQEVRRPDNRHAPQPKRIAEEDRSHPKKPDGCSANKGSHDTPRRGPREVNDNEQGNKIQASYNDNLPRCHASLTRYSSICRTAPHDTPFEFALQRNGLAACSWFQLEGDCFQDGLFFLTRPLAHFPVLAG